MSYAQDIIKKAKENLIGHIRYGVGLIDLTVNTHESIEEEPYTTEDDWKHNPSVEVETDNTYLDVEDCTYETRKVVKVTATETDIIVETEEGDELYGKNIGIESLIGISDCIDESYKNLLHK